MNSRDRELLAVEAEREEDYFDDLAAPTVRAGTETLISSSIALRAISQARIEEREAVLKEMERVCRACKATVASYPEGMCCHCREMPWPILIPVSDDRDE